MPADLELFDNATFSQSLNGQEQPWTVFRQALEHARLVLDQRFLDGHDINELVAARTAVIDQLLEQAWQHYHLEGHGTAVALIAVGGYGRGELHPHSDIDLLILLQDEPAAPLADVISQFVTFLWDLGLEIGHSVRTLAQCREEAAADLSVITNLLESRLVRGDQTLFKQLIDAIGPLHMWSSRDFFLGKCDEQKNRHERHNDTEYNLEPDVKSSPGGLRDLQTIMWIARRRFGMQTLASLEAPGFLTGGEYQLLARSRAFLWRVRYALHMLAGRSEDRLLLEYQAKVAELFGFDSDDAKSNIEGFMQQYYRTVMGISELGDLIRQVFEEQIVRDSSHQPPQVINERFRIRDGYLEHIHPYVFSKTPSAILEVFVLMAQHPELKGVRSETIRLLRDHRHLIDDNFRQDPRNTGLFVELFSCAEGMHMKLRRMNRYGILGRYLPEFGRVVGQMQHDLFHIYTVDAHSLNLVKHLRKLRHPDFAEKFALAGAIIARLPRPEVLYMTGLYHDIAKGRGGDHSELGAEDAHAFAVRHQLPAEDRRLMVWLVRNHLIMSITAQRKDLSDPDEIHAFATQVGDQMRLDYLYVLTVADINATNPKLWNSWRAQLLRQLYSETRRALRRGLANPLEREELIETRQAAALSLLCSDGACNTAVQAIWSHLGDDYFLRHSAGDIAWHTAAMLEHGDSEEPLVLVRESNQRGFAGGTQIFTYAPNRQDFFAATTAALAQLNLSVHEARITTSSSQFTIDSYIVLEADGDRIGDDPERIHTIQQHLSDTLRHPERYPDVIQRHIPRQLKHFTFAPVVNIHNDAQRPFTVVEVTAPDRPGLLARIGKVFMDFSLSLVNAKIITQGERIEDVFFITDSNGQPLSDPELCQQLQEALISQLSPGQTP